jgi:tetratricopeptide (TPR) repeat protein
VTADDLDLLERRGAKRHRAEQHEEAIADLREVIELDPSREFALRLASQSLEELGRLVEAVAMWDRLVALTPDDAHQLLYRAELNAKLERWSAVLADLDAIDKGELDGEEKRVLAKLRKRAST